MGSKLRPAPLTAHDAMRDTHDEPVDPRCNDVGAFGQPLVVDWPAHERANIEEAMNDGIAVVSYRCNSLRLVQGCHVEGAYGFLGVSKKEEVLRFEDADEVAANLPSFGIPMLTKINGELKRGGTLDLAIMLVGKRRTTIGHADRNQLKGGDDACKDATHFVRGAFVGAFAMGTGTRGSASLGVGLFSAGTKSAMVGNYRDGAPEVCEQAKAGDKAPAANCSAILRLELVGLNAPREQAQAPAPTQCPDGLVLADGKCTAPGAKTAHVCKMGDLGDCSTQCERGSVQSCGLLGRMYLKAEGTKANYERAIPLLEKACGKDDGLACASLGLAYDTGKGVRTDSTRAVELYEKSCATGEVVGCSNLGTMYHEGTGVPRDMRRAAELYVRACNGGNPIACDNIGAMYYGGRPNFPKDVNEGLGFFKRACDGLYATSCFNAATILFNGEGGKTDKPGAYALYRKACEFGDGDGCENAGDMRSKGDGVKKSQTAALEYFQRGCSFKHRGSCGQLHDRGYIFQAGTSSTDMPKD